MTKGASVITMTYTADGEKLSKAVTGGGATKNYVGGIEYAGANLEAIYFGEGRCTPNGATAFNYDYTVKDHLGNARVNFRANGTAITVLESMHYYPFGMLMEGIGTNTPTNDYTYNSKELNEDFGLNLYDYGARWYDASLGRWWSVDLMSENYYGSNVYHFALNNPIKFLDFAGLAVINGHQEAREAAIKEKKDASDAKAEFSGDKKSRAYKKMTKREKEAENKLAAIEERFQMVENVISELKTYNSSEFEALNSLTDVEGTNVDVYIKVVKGLKDDNTGQTVSGKTDVNQDQVTNILNASTGERRSIASVKSSMGANTAVIFINQDEPSKGATAAHEGGHTLYEVPNILSYTEYRNSHPGKGHSVGDPSGQRAFKEEGIFIKNKKNE